MVCDSTLNDSLMGLLASCEAGHARVIRPVMAGLAEHREISGNELPPCSPPSLPPTHLMISCHCFLPPNVLPESSHSPSQRLREVQSLLAYSVPLFVNRSTSSPSATESEH
jgi:hypothetical protein